MTGTFAGYLIYIKAVDGFGGLGRLTKEWRLSPNGPLDFTSYLKDRFPNEWTVYQTYLRLINKE